MNGEQDAGPNDEERGQPHVPIGASSARSSSSVSFALVAASRAMKATLYVFSGLPGTGKTALSQQLASRVKAVYLRIDTVEQALRDLCGIVVEGEGIVWHIASLLIIFASV